MCLPYEDLYVVWTTTRLDTLRKRIKPPYAERHVRWCEREENESRLENIRFPDLLDLFVGQGVVGLASLEQTFRVESQESDCQKDKVRGF